MSDKPYMEQRCTCGKISWNSDSGDLKKTHQVPDGFFVRDVPCDRNGGNYVNGVKVD